MLPDLRLSIGDRPTRVGRPPDGVGDKNVESAELVGDRRDRMLDRGALGEIETDDDRFAADCLDLASDVLCRAGVLVVREGDARVFSPVCDRDGLPHTSRSAGDEYVPAAQAQLHDRHLLRRSQP
jgi:hypothetical protein